MYRALLLSVLSASLAVAQTTQPAARPAEPQKFGVMADVAGYLQRISVTIHAEGAQGSGVSFVRDGVCYVWTAGHVVDGLRTVRDVVDPRTGSAKKVIEFRDAKVVSELIEGGRSVGRSEMDAEVLRYSDANDGHDLALLRVRKTGYVNESARFYLADEIPPVGVDLIHCGSLLGQQGSNSVTTGVLSQIGRVLKSGGVVYDQVSCPAFPGSSGGGVYLKDGSYVGMLVRGAGETFCLTVPVRRMREWAKKAGVEFAVDPSVPVPSEAELKQQPVEVEK